MGWREPLIHASVNRNTVRTILQHGDDSRRKMYLRLTIKPGVDLFYKFFYDCEGATAPEQSSVEEERTNKLVHIVPRDRVRVRFLDERMLPIACCISMCNMYDKTLPPFLIYTGTANVGMIFTQQFIYIFALFLFLIYTKLKAGAPALSYLIHVRLFTNTDPPPFSLSQLRHIFSYTEILSLANTRSW